MAARVVSYARSSWIEDYRAARLIRGFEDRFFRSRVLSVGVRTTSVAAYRAAGRCDSDPLTLSLLRGFPRIVRRPSA